MIDKDKLWELCEKFISDQEISCEETIYQSDCVITNAYEFIEQICDTVGYKKLEEDDENRS